MLWLQNVHRAEEMENTCRGSGNWCLDAEFLLSQEAGNMSRGYSPLCLIHAFLGSYGNPGRQYVSESMLDIYSATSTSAKPQHLWDFRLGSKQEMALSSWEEQQLAHTTCATRRDCLRGDHVFHLAFVSDHILVLFWKTNAKSWEWKCRHTERVSFFDITRYLL